MLAMHRRVKGQTDGERRAEEAEWAPGTGNLAGTLTAKQKGYLHPAHGGRGGGRVLDGAGLRTFPTHGISIGHDSLGS